MMNKRRNRIWIAILAAVLAALLLGCGWDSTPMVVVPTEAPTAQPTPERPTPRGTAAPTSETGTTGAESTTAPGETSNPGETANASQTPDASGSPDGTAAPATIDPNLVGLWTFTHSTYKGTSISAKDAGHSVVIRFYDNGSATIVIDNTETTGLQFTLRGATLTLTLYGETMFTLIYDGTYIIWEQEVFGDYDDLFFEKTGN